MPPIPPGQPPPPRCPPAAVFPDLQVKPWLCPFSYTVHRAIGYLALFLPITDAHSHDWLPEVLAVWGTIESTPFWDYCVLSLLGCAPPSVTSCLCPRATWKLLQGGRGGGVDARRRRGGGEGVGELGFRAGPLVLWNTGCWRRNTNLARKIPPPPPHMCSQNGQPDVGIVLSRGCWGRAPPPPPPRHLDAPGQRHGQQPRLRDGRPPE